MTVEEFRSEVGENQLIFTSNSRDFFKTLCEFSLWGYKIFDTILLKVEKMLVTKIAPQSMPGGL